MIFSFLASLAEKILPIHFIASPAAVAMPPTIPPLAKPSATDLTEFATSPTVLAVLAAFSLPSASNMLPASEAAFPIRLANVDMPSQIPLNCLLGSLIDFSSSLRSSPSLRVFCKASSTFEASSLTFSSSFSLDRVSAPFFFSMSMVLRSVVARTLRDSCLELRVLAIAVLLFLRCSSTFRCLKYSGTIPENFSIDLSERAM